MQIENRTNVMSNNPDSIFVSTADTVAYTKTQTSTYVISVVLLNTFPIPSVNGRRDTTFCVLMQISLRFSGSCSNVTSNNPNSRKKTLPSSISI